MHWYEMEIDGEVLSIEADTWKRDVETGAVVFVERRRDAARRLVMDHELLRVRIDRPYASIRRL